MRACLYRSDYGPAVPGYDPAGGGGAALRGYEGHSALLLAARNPDQLAAMERRIDRGESFVWCDQGYGWVAGPGMEAGFALLLAILVPLQAIRLWRRRRRAQAMAGVQAARG